MTSTQSSHWAAKFAHAQLPFVFVLLVCVPRDAWSQSGGQGANLAPLAALERAVIGAVSSAEKSVVAIASYPQDDEARIRQFSDLRADNLLLELQGTSARQPHAWGTGVIVDPAGLVLTQYTLVAEGDRHEIITINGDAIPATIKAADPRSGLAMLSVDRTDLPALPMAESDDLRKGQFVVSIGNPQAIAASGQASVSWGIVANLAQKVGPDIDMNNAPRPGGDLRTTLHHLGTLIQTDAKLTFSTGGGALVNLRGEMVGLNTSVATIAGHERPAGYAIPTGGIFRRVIEELKQGREVEYGLLGIGLGGEFNADGDASRAAGVLVREVVHGGPAQRAGLQEADVITHINNRPVPTSDLLQLAVGSLPPAQPTEIRYFRDGRSDQVEVKLAKYPVEGKQIVTNRPPAWRGVHVDYVTSLSNAEALGPFAVAGRVDPQGCVLVRAVEVDTPAWQSGIRPGMYISHVGDIRVTTPDEFRVAVSASDGHVSVRLTGDRNAEGASGQERDQEIPREL